MSSENVASISGSIAIYSAGRLNQRAIHCNSDWFTEEYYMIETDEDSIIFKKCYLDIPKKAYKMPKKQVITILSELPLGIFKVDEESTEDELVVYYR